MDRHTHSAPFGAGTGGELTPRQAIDWFEFFKKGTRREVLLLGEPVIQQVHFVKGEWKKLCGCRVGPCELCEIAATSPDVGKRQDEFYAPAMVREWSGKEFCQRVVVLSLATYQTLRTLVADSARGQRLDVSGVARGTSTRYVVKLMPGLPKGFPSILPPAFDVLPFIRARYGKPQEPSRPLVFLPAFRCEAAASAPGLPQPLAVSAADVRPDAADLVRMKELLARAKGEKQAAATPFPTPAPAPLAADPPTVAEPPAKKLGELAMAELVNDPANYGPPELVGVGTADGRPLISPPVSEGRHLNRATLATLAERRRKAAQANGGESMGTAGDAVAELLPSLTNGHAKSKGGRK